MDGPKKAIPGIGAPVNDAAILAWAFVPPSGEDEVDVRRPLVYVGERVLQKAFLMRGVANEDDAVVALDQALFDTLDDLYWSEL